MKELIYRLSRGRTRILVGKDAAGGLGSLPPDTMVVFPESVRGIVEKLDGNRNHVFHPVPDGEKGKTLDTVTGIMDSLSEHGFRRSSTLAAVGGGSTSDTAGMAASLYMRGLDFVSVPTTLLSMTDASMGGKTAINYNGVKNLVGSFYSPSTILMDTGLVPSMPDSLIREGLGEIAKYAVIMDRGLHDFLIETTTGEIIGDSRKLEHLLGRCADDKMGVVSLDEFDTSGKRVILNFGHTMGHAIEAASHFKVSHGVAVAHGMLMELDLGIELGLVERRILKPVQDLLGHLGLPDALDPVMMGKLGKSMSSLVNSDKKTHGTSISIPLPDDIGVPHVHELELDEISGYLDRKIEN